MRIKQLVEALRAEVSSLEPSALSSSQAAELVDVLSSGERICQAGRALATERVLRDRSWRAAGYRTPAQWMAARAKTTLSQAIASVQTAHRLAELPATREAFTSGQLSETQAAEIAAAAVADPQAESMLLDLASKDTVGALRDRCRQVLAAAASDEDACERIRLGRFLKHWTDPDGAVRVNARLAPDDGAGVVAVLGARAHNLMMTARRSGQIERADAYAADALVELVTGIAAPKAVVHVHVDEAALERGRTRAGETCRIEGIGPVPVEAARRFATEGILKVIGTEGADVTSVAHLGRTIPARVRTALEARDPTCVVPGCEVRTGLEIDHIIPVARGGPTKLDNLAKLCRYHHAQKTHRGWRLEGKPGDWMWVRGARVLTNKPRKSRPPPARAP